MPQVHYFGQEGLHNVLVIDLLGPNLEDLFDMCGRKFSIKTVCMAAKQMVSAPFSLVNVPQPADSRWWWCDPRTLCAFLACRSIMFHPHISVNNRRFLALRLP